MSELSKTNQYAILGMKADGLSDEEIIKHFVGKQKLVAEFLQEQSESTAQLTGEEDKKLENWAETIEEALDKLSSQNVDTTVARTIIENAITKIDLNDEPNVDTLLSFAYADKTNIMNSKQYGKSSTISMNEGASHKSDGVYETGHSRAGKDAIFKPKTPV